MASEERQPTTRLSYRPDIGGELFSPLSFFLFLSLKLFAGYHNTADMLILKEVENILEKGGFDYCVYGGCFDVAARRDFTLFLKILGNVDSLHENQARNLKILSKDFNATVALIGNHTRRENLNDNVIYERFEIPTFTPATLESIIINDMFPFLYRFRGGVFAEINPDKLRSNRTKAGLTQEELAEKVGTTKKSIYEHEHSRKKTIYTTVKKIEMLIGDVTNPLTLHVDFSDAFNEPKDRFEEIVSNDFKRIGFRADYIYQAPFNIIAKDEKIMILSKADENKKRIEKDVPHIAKLSEIVKLPALAVTKENMELDIPTIKEEELREIHHTRELRKRLR